MCVYICISVCVCVCVYIYIYIYILRGRRTTPITTEGGSEDDNQRHGYFCSFMKQTVLG